MHASLNEIESLCRKAARGAGLSWGLAEEAGKAARWLSAHGLNGPERLLAQLQRDDGCAYRQLAPELRPDAWHTPGAWLCPLIAGTTLCDHAHLLHDAGHIELQQVAQPQLLLPFVSAAARRLGQSLELSWDGCRLGFNATGEARLLQSRNLGAPLAARVRCCCMEPAPGIGQALGGTLASLDESIQQQLEQLAGRTYVPASEASRLLGAGAGLSDNN